MERKYVIVKGIVQGVGFRPFVYKKAVENNLKGWVKNTSEGVYIDLEGEEMDIENFLITLKNSPPPLSKIEEINVINKSITGYKSFTIEKSNEICNSITLISPDMSICKDCERDIKDPKNRRYKYPFTNCTNCGPRYSIINKLPYDRVMTTMNEFNMCPACKEEYENPLNRRFHAQPNACKDCGPEVWLTDNLGNVMEDKEPIERLIELLKKGYIAGVKGLGGFHLVCDGKNQQAIKILRERKRRPYKSLALMMKDMDTVKKYCEVNTIEEEILTGRKKPILLLNKKNNLLPDNISPDNNKLGVMLPYTPLHMLLFNGELDVLVMTSANSSGLPMVYKNKDAVEKLKHVVDYFLFHNREIHMPVDDSVAQVIMDKEMVIRSARGYAPIDLRLDDIKDSLACGSHLKNTFAISKEGHVFISPHIGDMENLEVYNSFVEGVKHFEDIYSISPEIIAFDMHPDFLGWEYSKKLKGIKVPIQHHHAHIVSCMIDNNINTKVIGVAYDGTGYGTDGKVWGGEFLICNYKDFERIGHLDYVLLPGGEIAIKEPYRIALSYLYKSYGQELENFIPWEKSLENNMIKNILSLIKKNLNCVEASSMGRLFDGVSAILDLKRKVTYEGESAIALENICDLEEKGVYSYEVLNNDGEFIISEEKIIADIVKDLKNGLDKRRIAKRFHNTVITFTIEICKKIRDIKGINEVALSGGVFQNNILLKGITIGLQNEGFKVYTHSKIPTNDGGISLGQLVIANYRSNYR
ncbi:carbamoyltransferase HypF [Clostridium lundense]|uniref:carbamoyltransferase HypF n=1 Tax=Clostridium lundense TaxID=319475 RepID=UPI0004842120|nr:carbamoyltransferase HypF [Clostridium lundense]